MAQITKRNGTYRITVSCGYDCSGKQVRQTLTYKPTPKMTATQVEKEVNRQAILFEEAIKTGGIVNNSIKFEEMAKKWLKQMELEGRLKPTTMDRYYSLEPRIYHAIGYMKLNSIRTIHVQNFINSLAADGVNMHTGGGLSTKTQNTYKGFISDVYKYAIAMGVATKNPTVNVHAIVKPQKEGEMFTLDEAQEFLNALEDAPPKYKMFFNLAIFTGMRNGEIVALEWKDIDFENSILSVNRTAFYHNHATMTGAPKTKSSFRKLKISDDLLLLLKEYKGIQAEQRMKCGDKWIATDRLFTTYNGGSMGVDSARYWLSKFCKKNGFKQVNVHSFRHLNASLLIKNGVDIKTVSAILGHSQVSTTLNIYAHSFAEAQAQALENVANLIKFG